MPYWKQPALPGWTCDDFEQALEQPQEGQLHRVRSDLVETIRSVTAAFDACAGKMQPRLLITSRYRFTLPFQERVPAARLLYVHLPPMEEYKGRKQAAAKVRQIGSSGKRGDAERIERCIITPRGSPGTVGPGLFIRWGGKERRKQPYAAYIELARTFIKRGIPILERSRDGLKKLGMEDLAQQAQQLIDTFSK